MADTIAIDAAGDDATRRQLRQKIAVKVGRRTNPDTPLEKRVLNSVHAYLTGDFYYPPASENKPDHHAFESAAETLRAVVVVAEMGEPDDDWSMGLEEQPGGLRRGELAELVRKMDEEGDHRDWTP